MTVFKPRSDLPDHVLLLQTTEFAARKHKEQRRKNAGLTPYINHPIQVASIISSPESSLYPSPPVQILQAAVLHDTVEDTDTTEQELIATFGPTVATIVMECTDDITLSSQERKAAQVERVSRISDDAKHVKLADKIANLTDLLSEEGCPKGWSVQRIQEYFVWAKSVTDPCVDVNPGLGATLDELYRNATFMHSGKVYKAHPTWE